MKGKRTVELEPGQEIDEETYEELYTHARNSGIWYANNLPKTTHEFRRKLQEKGYPEGGVLVRRDSGLDEVDIIGEVVDSLVESLWFDDAHYAERYAERKKNARYGMSRVKRELRFKGISNEMVAEAIETVYGDGTDEEIRSFLAADYACEAPRASDQWKLRRKLLTHGVTRGWSMDDIMPVLDELMEEYQSP